MLKADLRKEYLARREALSNSEIDFCNDSITQHFQSLDLDKVRYLHCFLPIVAKKEIDTSLILNYVWDNYPGLQVVVPVAVFSTKEMFHVPIGKQTPILINKWGIHEPIVNNPIPSQEIDMVLVPLLAADRLGHRVGYGAGFYDRFLSQVKPETKVIGLSQFPLLNVEITDVLETDIPLGAIITPEGISYFNSGSN